MNKPLLETLAEIEAAIWSELVAAVGDKTHAWRTPVLATVDGDGADARVVVLREVVERSKRLLFYTDERAGKVSQLREHPHGTLVMWSRTLGWQLRCRARLGLESPGLSTTSRWARIALTPAAQDYLAPAAPGSLLPELPDRASGAVSRDYFAVVNADVERLDWLELGPAGSRRAVFEAKGAHWVQP